ncbi:SAM-dependent methyltransferase [Amycolatopsis sp. GM8]|uniref:SAM-dependent methyltransferase n=1 Tax=Amycolatopsis sp. GM8 TaxID=2896530 RepID=UPI001F01EA9A|nr:SAM-dependent methyltransferase [Amycolatopsis sp. GM8]
MSLTGVGKTALGVAVIRAHESRRADRLFDDPYAQAFVDALPDAFPQTADTTGIGATFVAHAAIRTRFFDDYLLGAGCAQVVLLAAGLDTRAFRLSWPPGTGLFELDLPDVLAFKEKVLANATPRCARTVVCVDLRMDWTSALSEAGFDPGVKTAWLAEGLLTYLTADEARRLMTAVSELSAPGSTLALEHGSVPAQAWRLPAQYTSLWKGGLGDDAPEWFASHGWQVRFTAFSDVAISYARTISVEGGFLTLTRP